MFSTVDFFGFISGNKLETPNILFPHSSTSIATGEFIESATQTIFLECEIEKTKLEVFSNHP